MIDHGSEVPMWYSDANSGLVLDVNDAALRFWRYSREEFIGMPAIRLLVEEELPRQRELAARDRWGETGPWRCRLGDGAELFVTVRWQKLVHNRRCCDFVFVYAAGESLEAVEPIMPFQGWKTTRDYKSLLSPREPLTPRKQA